MHVRIEEVLPASSGQADMRMHMNFTEASNAFFNGKASDFGVVGSGTLPLSIL